MGSVFARKWRRSWQGTRNSFWFAVITGVDERVRVHLINREISIGDYVLTGGELSAMVIVDSVSRLVPGFWEQQNPPQ